jgi:hypothetical protein
MSQYSPTTSLGKGAVFAVARSLLLKLIDFKFLHMLSFLLEYLQTSHLLSTRTFSA